MISPHPFSTRDQDYKELPDKPSLAEAAETLRLKCVGCFSHPLPEGVKALLPSSLSHLLLTWPVRTPQIPVASLVDIAYGLPRRGNRY